MLNIKNKNSNSKARRKEKNEDYLFISTFIRII